MNVGDPSRSGRFATVTFLKAVLASTSCLLAAVFTIAVASLNAAAQSPPIETQTTEQIVATPISVFSERAQLWPSSTLGDDELSQRLPAQPLSEILSSVPGLQARQNGSPMISIRGSAAADRVLTLYEGIPLNLGDGIGPSDLFLPTETIGRIRIFKGPASVFYGASAMAGALDHETRRFSAPAVRVTAGSYDGFAGEQSALAVAPFGNEKQGGQAAAFYERKPGRYPFTSTSTSITGVRENNASETTRVSAVGNARIGELELHPLFLLARSLGESPTGLAFPSPSTYDSVGLLTGIEASQALTTETRATLRASDVRQWGGFDRGKLTESTSFVSRTMLASDLQENLSPSLVGRTFADYQWDRLAASYLGDASLTQTDFELGQSFSYALSSTLSLEPVLRYRAESGDFFKALGLLAHLFGRLSRSLALRSFFEHEFFQRKQGTQTRAGSLARIGI
jgi:outer membrane receptor protein involved in Fe transport